MPWDPDSSLVVLKARGLVDVVWNQVKVMGGVPRCTEQVRVRWSPSAAWPRAGDSVRTGWDTGSGEDGQRVHPKYTDLRHFSPSLKTNLATFCYLGNLRLSLLSSSRITVTVLPCCHSH